MISYVERNSQGFYDSTETWIEFTEKGDNVLVKPATPIIGVTGLNDVSVVYEGSLEFSFRYSVDEGLNWGDWESLTSDAIREIVCKKNHWLCFEVKIVSTEDAPSYFKSIDFDFMYDAPSVPDFWKESHYSKMIPYYNHEAVKWTLNVLEKMYHKGIVPTFIERASNENWDDEDYINFWYSLIYPVALKNQVADLFVDMLWYPRVLHDWLESKGLILGDDIHLDELFYLMTHFLDEMWRRGSLSIFDTRRFFDDEFEDSFVRGEFLRLLNANADDEFLNARISAAEQGWVLGVSSPCGYENTSVYENFTKAWENALSDRSKYPLINDSSVEFIDGKVIVKGNGSDYAGIGFGDMDKNIIVSPTRDYFFSVKFKCTADTQIKFGCNAYDNVFDKLQLLDLNDRPSDFFLTDESLVTCVDKEITVFGEIRSCNTFQSWGQLSAVGRVLKFPSDVSLTNVQPFFAVKSFGDVEISEIKFGLLADKSTFLMSMSENYIAAINNNFALTEDALREILVKKLLPYNMQFLFDFVKTVVLSLSPSTLNFSSEGGQENVRLISNDDLAAWVFTDVPEWATILPMSGVGSSVQQIHVVENKGRRLRQANVLLTQAGAQANVLLTSESIVSISSKSQKVRIAGTSNFYGLRVEGWDGEIALFVNDALVEGWDGANVIAIANDPGAMSEYSFEIELSFEENTSGVNEVYSLVLYGVDENGVSQDSVSIEITQRRESLGIQISPEHVILSSMDEIVEVNVYADSGDNWTAVEL